MTVFNTKITERTAYLPGRVRCHVTNVIAPIAEAAEIAQCTYDTAVAGAEKAGSERILDVLRMEANRTREHFDEVLNVLCMLASEILADVETDTPMDDAIQHAPAVSAPTIRDVPPHRFKLRDLVNVTLEMPVIGKVIARSAIIAICELVDGCYWYDSTGKTMSLVPKGTQFFGTTDLEGKITPIIPINGLMGYIMDNKALEDEGIIGLDTRCSARCDQLKCNRCDGRGFIGSTHSITACAHCTGLGTTCGTCQGWKTSHMVHVVYHQCINYAGSRVWSTDPLKKPKFKVLRYEQSYRVLVAAPWDFGLEALKKRSLGGERLDVRYEIERVLLGQQTPTIIYGAGVGFEHVLESQLKPFGIRDIMCV